MASEEIGLELSKAPYKALVWQTIDDFVQQLREEKEEDEEEEEEIEEEEIIYKNKRTYDDCVNNYRGQQYVSIRYYYNKNGKDLPSDKGISLTVEQWLAFKEVVPAIENAVEEMKLRV
ncbi:transcriptional coactivator p15 (PC4) family protein (KELP) [Trifolium repens]|nr:transcriptional coactivator p15 (PC4) family protein (KELP) [Trifolium repens]